MPLASLSWSTSTLCHSDRGPARALSEDPDTPGWRAARHAVGAPYPGLQCAWDLPTGGQPQEWALLCQTYPSLPGTIQRAGKYWYWNKSGAILKKFAALAAPPVVKMTTSSTASDQNFIIMATFTFTYGIVWENSGNHMIRLCDARSRVSFWYITVGYPARRTWGAFQKHLWALKSKSS